MKIIIHKHVGLIQCFYNVKTLYQTYILTYTLSFNSQFTIVCATAKRSSATFCIHDLLLSKSDEQHGILELILPVPSTIDWIIEPVIVGQILWVDKPFNMPKLTKQFKVAFKVKGLTSIKKDFLSCDGGSLRVHSTLDKVTALHVDPTTGDINVGISPLIDTQNLFTDWIAVEIKRLHLLADEYVYILEINGDEKTHTTSSAAVKVIEQMSCTMMSMEFDVFVRDAIEGSSLRVFTFLTFPISTEILTELYFRP